jgi:DNA-binding GntR family transcriptional regulator
MDRLPAAKPFIDRAYEVILDAICNGDLKPGERLTQEVIAARLNISRQPVTHALAMLKTQGFVAEVGHRRLVVAPIDPQQLVAIYQFRSAVEPLAVRLATPRMTPGDIERGRQIIALGQGAVRASDSHALLRADVDFHSFIYQLSGNSVIVETMALNWHHALRAMGAIQRRHSDELGGTWQEHESVLNAMADGNADLAAELMRAHMTLAYDRTTRLVSMTDNQVRPIKQLLQK